MLRRISIAPPERNRRVTARGQLPAHEATERSAPAQYQNVHDAYDAQTPRGDACDTQSRVRQSVAVSVATAARSPGLPSAH